MTEPTGATGTEDQTEQTDASAPVAPETTTSDPTPAETPADPAPVEPTPEAPAEETPKEEVSKETAPDVVPSPGEGSDVPAPSTPTAAISEPSAAVAEDANESFVSNKAAAAKRIAETNVVADDEHDTVQQRTTLASVPMPVTVEDPQGIERIVSTAPDNWTPAPLEADPKEVARVAAVQAKLEEKRQARLDLLKDRTEES